MSCPSPIYSVCPATCWCFPSSHKETESPIDAHHAPPLPSPSLFDSHTHTHTRAALLKAAEKSRPPLSYYCGVELMLVKLAAIDDWEPPGPWSADIILPLKCYPALRWSLPVCVCACACVHVCVRVWQSLSSAAAMAWQVVVFPSEISRSLNC